jgi:hypothetical protein
MSDDIEDRLARLTPRGAPPELRGRVLNAVTSELRTEARTHHTLFLWLVASAAAVLAGLALNVWVSAELDRRLTIVLGPPPVSGQVAEIAAEIAHVTNPAVGQWAYQRLAVVERHDDEAIQSASRLKQMIQQLTLDLGEIVDEAPQKDSRMDGDRHGSRDRGPARSQRLLRLEHRNTA